MAKFLFVYHGGGAPKSEEEAHKLIQVWQHWLANLGEAVVDAGNPVGLSTTVNADGSVIDNGGANPASGYGIFNATSTQQAVEIAKSCPMLISGGSVELAEIHEI